MFRYPDFRVSLTWLALVSVAQAQTQTQGEA
jgi:hypothetical protein